MKVILISVLDAIIEKYKIPRGVRARKEIEEWTEDIEPAAEWIPLEEDLPEDSRAVATICSGRIDNDEFKKVILLAGYQEGKGWVFPGISGMNFDIRVLYWAPLPDLTKVMEKELEVNG